MATAFLLILERLWYDELILLPKNDYSKQQKNYPKTLTDMYRLMVAFDPTRPTPVSGGRNKGMKFGNVAVEPGTEGDGDHGGGGGTVRNIECWHCGGDHMKRDFPKRAEDNKIKKNDGEDAEKKRVEVMGGQLHAMFTSSGDEPSGTDFSELGEEDEFTWHQFHVKGRIAQDFEEHAPVVMHNDTGRVVPLTWLLLDSQSTVDLISNPKILLNIRKVRIKDAIRVHCNSGVKVVDRVGDLPGYGTV